MSATEIPRRAPAATRRRALARVRGAVQGVGFRPNAYRLAAELELAARR